jgi:energy-coupling factor transporter ATP-binding protein EcfA2
MPSVDIVIGSPIIRTARVIQLEGMFDVPPADRVELRWTVNLPLEEKPWNVGLIVGPSGSGKTTIARRVWPDLMDRQFDWPTDRSIVDAFPATLSIKDIVALLSAVGFSSPPSWLRPYSVLSYGEQFRVTMARLLAELPELAVVDEFTSVVDRQVARIGSFAIAKVVRRRGQKLIAITCHEDIEEWLQPDWVYRLPDQQFVWRSLQGRPPIKLEIARVHYSSWKLFAHHHYLSGRLNRSAHCYCAWIENRPVAFSAWLAFVGHTHHRIRRATRTVVLPDFQGLGIGNVLVETIAGAYRATGCRVINTTSHPSFIAYRKRHPELWRMRRAMGLAGMDGGSRRIAHAFNRLTSSWEYIGPPWEDKAAALSFTA